MTGVVEPRDPEARLSYGRYAQLVSDVLGVPAAVVWTAGESAPAPPWLQAVCDLALEQASPVIVPDARLDGRLGPGPEPGACLGIPLTVGDETVGALCALDRQARDWTDRDVHLLTGLGAACSAELALRDSRSRAQARQQEAESARDVAEQDALEAQHRSERRTRIFQESARHSRLLLALSESLTATTTVDSVLAVVREAAITYLGATSARFELDGFTLVGETGADTRRSLPVPLSGGLPGRLTLIWADEDRARPWVDADHAPGRPRSQVEETIAALVHYASTALDRAILLQERRSVAATLQHAMLTTLPARTDVELAARYVPAAGANQVGGDWYDAVAVEDGLAVVIGDVAGHDIEAAATMGQVRSILRGLLVDSPRPPSEMIARLDTALRRLGMPTSSSLVLAGLRGRDLSWANAGHPRPVRVDAAGRANLLTGEPGLLLGIPYDLPRRTQHLGLDPGDTLVLYTDGLVQRPGERLIAGQERLLRSVSAHHRLPLPDLLDRLLRELVRPDPDDDCAVLAVRVR